MKIKNILAAFVFARLAFSVFGQTVPLVNITMPTNGATFFAPANIYLRAEASDTNGVASTQILVGTNLVGSTQTNIAYAYWTNVPIGTYVISGEAMNNLQIRGTSAPVTISVVSNPLPAISITSTDSHAAEPGSDTGTFNVSRVGNLTNDLTVFYSISNNASNGVDYVALPGSVTIPAGYAGTNITIQVVDDTQVETTEAVTLTLKTNASYRLGSPTSATVTIFDNETNHPPTIQIVAPQDAASFADPANIILTAEASDLDAGAAPTVIFYRNGSFLNYGVKNPTNNLFTFVWTNIPSGNFVLTARARDGINEGINATSAPVNITVTRTNESPFVWGNFPSNGSVFSNISILTISAYATPGATGRTIKQVEFYMNGALLGTPTNSTSTGSFYMQWSNPPAGNYVFTVKATDNTGASAISAPSSFSILAAVPYVTISASDSTASETGDTGTFFLSRTGSTANPLTVYYKLSGTASNGVDYGLLPGSATFAAGVTNIYISVTPIDDAIVEGTESVVLTLLATNGSFNVGSGISSATVYISDNDTNLLPSVTIFNPTNEATFNLPTNILLQAEAHDPDGTVLGVAFYRGTNWIGTVYGSNTISGSTLSLLWTNAVAGDFSITAIAYDNMQKAGTSAPVHVVIKSQTVSNAVPAVTIYYPTNGSKFTAPTNIDLVAIASESNGAIASVEFFANGSSLGMATNNPISVQPANIYRLSWINPLPGSYELKAKATDTNGVTTVSTAVNVTILSNTPPNLPPTISILSPANNSVFYGPTNISIAVQASDNDGQVSRVYFFKGSQVLGGSTVAPFSFIWTNAQPGAYGITARAFDNLNASSTSAPVYITIKSMTEFSFVSRSLPLWYVPGVKLTVRLQASPKTNATSYVVHDAPPAGWIINSVGENGSIDTGGAGVTFGPFNDRLARTFTYMVTPPLNEAGEKHFVGTGTANDITSPIVGVTAVTAAQPHPADINPTNFFIGTNELDAYTTAWKRCQTWPVSPSPVPVNYLTRAGYIAQGGGAYAISTNYPSPLPPLIWVRDASVPDVTSNSLGSTVPWTTNNYGTAVASMPTNYFSNVTFAVSISVTPAAACSAYAVEDRPPEGWIVTNVNNGGFYCPILKKVKWGLFLDNQARTLTYQVTPSTNLPNVVGFSGVASFDGINVPITGRRYTYLNTGAVPPAKLQSMVTAPNGDRIIKFLGQPGVVYQLEGSENLTDWTPLDQLLNNDGVLDYTDPATTNFVNRFYRAIPTSGN